MGQVKAKQISGGTEGAGEGHDDAGMYQGHEDAGEPASEEAHGDFEFNNDTEDSLCPPFV